MQNVESRTPDALRNRGNETRKYWIGMELPHDAVDVEGGELLVRCFRIFQSEKLEEQMVSTQVQSLGASKRAIKGSVKAGKPRF